MIRTLAKARARARTGTKTQQQEQQQQQQCCNNKPTVENENKTSENENIMNTLKLEWKSLEDDEKDHIWKYLQVLMKLTDKYLKENLKSI